MSIVSLQPEFVTSVPADLEEGVLYVSIPFRTSMHLCACGCGRPVVMPIRPGAWHLTYDGETVSMSPSVGSQRFPCRSHYWITQNHIRWAPSWNDDRIVGGARPSNSRPATQQGTPRPPDSTTRARGVLRRIKRLWDR